MPPVLEQHAYASVAKYQSRTATPTFSSPTKPGSLLIAVCLCAGALPVGLKGPDGFSLIGQAGLRDLEMAVWYRQNAPSVTKVTVGFDPLTPRSIQARAFEYSGMAQSGVLDKVQVRSNETRDPYSGFTGNVVQNDELALAFVANQYASTSQLGFRGNLSRLYESVSPQSWSGGSNVDWERSRLSIHQAITTTGGNFYLDCDLSTTRRWISILCTFKGGSLGPLKITSKQQTTPMLTTSARGDLTLFGPLSSKETAPESPILTATTVKARMGPFNYQYLLGGWNGLLIGSGTNYHVQEVEGLDGHQVRTSDEDRPRGDGAYRGIDLQSARQILFKMNVGKNVADVERNMNDVFRALVPQRNEDWELIWRHPTQPLKMMRVRPVELPRTRNNQQLVYSSQSFVLRAADPKQYSANIKTINIPVTPTDGDPLITQVVNIGNSPAYPVITIKGPTNGIPVTRLQLVNQTALVIFECEITLLTGSTLVGDMEARVTDVSRPIITLDGQSKYGAWQLPRDPFRIEPDPTGFGGYNEIYLRTEPTGAPVSCTLSYRDTWAG